MTIPCTASNTPATASAHRRHSRRRDLLHRNALGAREAAFFLALPLPGFASCALPRRGCSFRRNCSDSIPASSSLASGAGSSACLWCLPAAFGFFLPFRLLSKRRFPSDS
ncbi:hypothetical protein AB1Y20_015937 [Prymnesium parvum]|uniref:Uncharacterized protein n=1 Tax=Prymnesium parvum TaxID=97485 RepID=A0AB34K1Y6_PRYPA